MQASTVTIGRNVGDAPMDGDSWSAFQERVRSLLESYRADLVVDADYRGAWNGTAEDAHIFQALTPDGTDLSDLPGALALVAWEHRQDAIGLVTGESNLVGPEVAP